MSETFEQSYLEPIPTPTDAFNNNGDAFSANANIQSANYSPNTSAGWQLAQNGDATLNNVVIKGKITATAGGVIGGFNVNDKSLTDTGDTFGLDSTVTGGDDVRLYAGSTNANKNTAPIRIYESGVIKSGSEDSVVIDGVNKKITVGSGGEIVIDGANKRIQSSNYSAGVSGFKISSDLVEAENGIFRGTLRGSTFAYDVISAVGGQLLISNASTLASDMTAADSSTMTIKNDTTFAVNDILIIRGIATSGVQEEYFRVTNIGSAPTYIVTRDLAGSFATNSNPIWKAGSTVVKIGSSDGSSTYSGGWLRLIGEGTNSPYYSVYSRTGVAYNAYTEVARLGNLNGFLDYASDLYGIAIGDTYNNLTYDTTNSLRIKGGTFFEVLASNTLRTSSINKGVNYQTNPTKVAEILLNEVSGTIRVDFTLRVSSGTGSGRIYKNGVAYGTQRQTSGTSNTTYSEDLSFVTGDLIQLYLWGNSSNNVYADSFTLNYDKQVKPETNTVNL